MCPKPWLNFFFGFLIFLFPLLAKAQTSLIISGYVKDAKLAEAVPYASVTISGTSTGTATNSEGRFVIAIPETLINGTLIISCMGYESAKILIAKLNSTEQVQVKLKQSSLNINAVTVSAESAAQIVAHAYRNVPLNYPLSNTLYTGFYRESNIQSRSRNDTAGQYSYAIEAVISMNKPSYRKAEPMGDVKLEQTRKSMLMQQDSFIKWYGGVHVPLRQDVVKMRADYIDPANLKKYDYKLDGVTTYIDKQVYKISFKLRANAKSSGLIYITTDNYAIVKVIANWTASGSEITLVKYYSKKLEVNYQPMGNKWYLQSINIQNIGREKRINSDFKIKAEYVTTRIDTNRRIDFEYADKVQLIEILSAKPTPYDPNFWKDYNILAETHQLKALQLDTTNRPVVVTHPTLVQRVRSAINIYALANLLLSGKLRTVYNMPVQLVSSQPNTFMVNYTSTNGQTVVNQLVSVPATGVSIGFGGGLEYDLFKNLGVHITSASGYGDFQFNQFNTGATYRVKLTPPQKRPLHLLFGLDYASNTFFRKLSQYDRQETAVLIEGEEFKSDIKPQLFSSLKMLKPHLGFSIDINRRLSLYVQADYNVMLDQNDGLRFTNHTGNLLKDLFSKHQDVSLNSPGTSVNVDGQTATSLPFKNNFTITIGLNGLLRF